MKILISAFTVIGLYAMFSCTPKKSQQNADNNIPAPVVQPVSILVNQVGYDANSEKIAVVQFRDTVALAEPGQEFQIINKSGEVVFTSKLVYYGRINDGTSSEWGARYWTADFSEFNGKGEHKARIQSDGQDYFSYQFTIDSNIIFNETIEPAFRFFWYQRCGFGFPGYHPACHLDDARNPYLNNKNNCATGGYHNAGDLNKYATISCRSVYAMYVLAREASGLGLADSIREQIVDEGLWGSEFLLKMWMPGKGTIYQEVWNSYEYWGRPDLETDNIAGTEDDRPFRGIAPSAMTACALAAAARETGRTDYRSAAEDLWKTAADSLFFDKEEIWARTSGGFPVLENDSVARLIRRTSDLLMADLELEALTENERYTSDAHKRAESLADYQLSNGYWPSDIYTRTVYQGIAPAALALYIKAHPTSKSSEKAIKALRLWIDRLTRITNNPYNLIPWEEGIFFNPYLEYWYVGQNSQYLSNAWALYLASPLLDEKKAESLADRQIDWILGANPYNLCMMEGKGSFNSPSYLYRWAPDVDRGAVPGAVPNGFCRINPTQDQPYFDVVNPANAVSYHTSEPWEPHNAFYILAVSARRGNHIP